MVLRKAIPLRSFAIQTLRIMRIVAVLSFAFCMHAGATGYSQTVTLQLKNVPLTTVFAEIKNQTGYSFVYTQEDLQKTKNIDIDVTHVGIAEALHICFLNQPVTFTIVEKVVVIKQINNPSFTETGKGPPSHSVSGKITNSQGEALNGASVIIKRTKRGTQTNARGEFVLDNLYPDDVITISYTGYKAQSVKVGNNANLTLVMDIATDQLDKVVVRAYGTTTQRFNTGNIATVSAEEIEKQPVTNVLEALVGRVPGMVITQTNGYASAPINVEIRGRANIVGMSDPLFIVDGVPMFLNGTGNRTEGGLLQPQFGMTGPAHGQSPLFSINPSDIEAVTVLKDADATAIYGSRGANGVVIITTKKGKVGKTKWDVNVYQGYNKLTNRYDLMNMQQYLAMRREAFKNDGIQPDQGNAYDMLVWDTTKYFDLQKEFWGRLGKQTDIETGISGGDRLTNFRISGGYHRTENIFTYSGAEQRASVAFNLTHKSLNQRLMVSFSNEYSYAQSNLTTFNGSVTTAPNTPPVFDENHNLNYRGWEPVSYTFPYASLLWPYTAKTNFLNSGLNISFEILKGLSASVQFGYSTVHLKNELLQPISSFDPTTNPHGASEFGNTNQTTGIVEPQIKYSAVIAKGKLDVLVGGSYQYTTIDANDLSGGGYVNDNLLHSISNAAQVYGSDGFLQYKYGAGFGRLTYNWDDKYIINLSGRRDGSSRFGPGNQFGNFGSIGGAWIFSEEKFIKDHVSFLSFGKLRGSYGLTGSDAISDYLFLTQWSGSIVPPYRDAPAYVPTRHANPFLHWQTNHKSELAIELGFLQSRLNLQLAFYRNRCGDQLVGTPLASITGFTGVTQNFPATVQNDGVEGTFNAKIIDKKELTWNFSFSIGANHNILLAFPNIEKSVYFSTYEVGKPLNITKVLHFAGVDPMTGTYVMVDKNKDGQIDQYNDANSDLFLKDLSIKFDGGFGTDFQYKGFQVSLFFNFRKQELKSALFAGGIPGMVNVNQGVQVLDRWQKPGDHSKYARFTTNYGQSDLFFTNSDAMYSDGSYIRLRNLSVSYDFPSKWLTKAGFQKIRFYLRGENIFILTKYNGIDPDIPGDIGVIPPPKTLVLGLEFTL